MGEGQKRDSWRDSDPEALQALIGAMSHPVRSKLFSNLVDSPGSSPNQLAERIGEPPSRVRYHLRRLRDLGLVGVKDEETRRGAIERFYEPLKAAVISDEVDAILDDSQKRAFSIEILKMIVADAARAISAGTFTSRADRCLARTMGEVDAEGWDRLAKLNLKILDEIQETIAESGERLRESGEDPIPVLAAQLLFEYSLKKG